MEPEYDYYDVIVKYRYYGPRAMASVTAQHIMGSILQPYGGTPHAIQPVSIDVKEPDQNG